MEWDPYKATPSALWICQNIYEYVEYDQTVSGCIDVYYMALDLRRLPVKWEWYEINRQRQMYLLKYSWLKAMGQPKEKAKNEMAKYKILQVEGRMAKT